MKFSTGKVEKYADVNRGKETVVDGIFLRGS
jgi:hypothetical protein